MNTKVACFSLFKILRTWLLVTVAAGWLVTLSAHGFVTDTSNVGEIPVYLPEWQPHATVKMQAFEFGPSSKLESIWGDRMRQLCRVYFQEWLPAIFARTLVIEEFEVKGG